MSAEAGEQVAEAVAAFSRWINAQYPPDLDPEAHLWRRITKVGEESGEVQDALRGYLGENPRKGVTHTLDEVIDELLDCAGAALGAVEHLTGNDGSSVQRLADRLRRSAAKAGVA